MSQKAAFSLQPGNNIINRSVAKGGGGKVWEGKEGSRPQLPPVFKTVLVKILNPVRY